MKYTLEIYRNNEKVNTFTSTEEIKVLKEFTKCATCSLRGIKTTIKKDPYADKIKVVCKWDLQQSGGIAKYCYKYLFEGLCSSN